MLQIVKFGTACLFNEYGAINYALLSKRAREIEGSLDDTVLVVSGAIELGKRLKGEQKSNSELSAVELEGYARIGQNPLMSIYGLIFSNINPELLTCNDLEDDIVKDRIIYNTNNERIVAINNNGHDNDGLAASVLKHMRAERLLIFGHYDGFYDSQGQLVPQVDEVTDKLYTYCNGNSKYGNGGFVPKLNAGKFVMEQGKYMIISNVKYALADVIKGTVPRTVFKK